MHTEYEPSRHSNGHEFLSGLLFGAVVGAAVGLLFAPRSGAEIRGQMAASADRVRRQAGQTYDRASSVMTEAVERGKEAWHRGRERFEEARDAAAHEVSAAVNKM